MRPICHLSDLPAPPPGRHGWPWDEESPARFADAAGLPEISLITPSYNQGIYIEETIRSILLQNYPNLEYFIIDGGSTDETLEIIRKYEPWLSGWVSERDKGQSDAINKGFARCGGEIFNWLCSDDVLAKGALHKVAEVFSKKPDTDVVAGACFFQFDDEPAQSSVMQVHWKGWELTPFVGAIYQPSCFFRRTLVKRPEIVRRDLHYCMDRELWTYLCSEKAKWEWTDETLSVFRFTGENKSVVGRQQIIDELEVIYRTYVKEKVPLPWLLRKSWLPLIVSHLSHPSSVVRFLALGASRALTLVLRTLYPSFRVKALQSELYHFGFYTAQKR
jgi:glycosyltransferase involved in cell wall biosynthesis